MRRVTTFRKDFVLPPSQVIHRLLFVHMKS